jgi:DNA-binding transcriptional LysR family regulator
MDRFQGIQTFVAVVESGSFARAAERLDRSVSAVSRDVAELEQHLDARLLNRTTRRLSLTEAGRAFHERAVQLLADLEEAEESASAGGVTPRGTLKLTCPITYGERVLAPVIAAFVCCASPAYLARHGTPGVPEDLAKHACLTYEFSPSRNQWRFLAPDGSERLVRIGGPIHANNGRMLAAFAAEGAGIGNETDFNAAPELEAGRLVPILTDWSQPGIPIHAAYPSRRHLSAKVRAFVDHLAAALAAPA